MADDNKPESNPPTLKDLLRSGLFRIATEEDNFASLSSAPTPDRIKSSPGSPTMPVTKKRVPQIPMSMTDYGEIIGEQDMQPLLEAVGLEPTPTTTHIDLARRLDAAAMTFILKTRVFSISTPGELATFLVSMDKSIGRVLARFSAHGSFDLDVDRLARILRGDYAGVPTGLRVEEEVRRWFYDTLALQRRLKEVAEGFNLQKGAPREAPQAELEFVQKLAGIFEDVFERELGYSTDVDGVRGGPGVRFVIEVAALIKKRLPAANMDGRDDPVPNRLTQLTSPGPVADRIRDVRDGALRKR